MHHGQAAAGPILPRALEQREQVDQLPGGPNHGLMADRGLVRARGKDASGLAGAVGPCAVGRTTAFSMRYAQPRIIVLGSSTSSTAGPRSCSV
jgi:hypothetical protein